MKASNAVLYISSLIATSGCYTTAPTHWSVSNRRDTVESTETKQNGSRLELTGKSNDSSMLITATDVAVCRSAVRGHVSVTESGMREGHAWPASILGLGMMGTGAYFMYDGLEGDKDSSSGVKLGKTVGGIAAAAVGSIVLGKCALTESCEPDTTMQKRPGQDIPFYRWSSEGREDCSGRAAKPVANTGFKVQATFADSTQVFTWTYTTNQDGRFKADVMELVHDVAAYCGKAKVTVVIAGGLTEPQADTAERPWTGRDNRAVLEQTVAASTKRSLEDIDDTVRAVARSCEEKRLSECFGGRLRRGEIEDSCQKECDSSSEVQRCREQLEDDLITGTDDESVKEAIETRYRQCKRHEEAVSSCKTSCVNAEVKRLCP